MKQIGIALHSFHDASGRLPAAASRLGQDSKSSALLGWMVRILPYLEQENAYRESFVSSELDANPYHNPPHGTLTTIVRTYVCPADSRLLTLHQDLAGLVAAYTSFIGVAGSFSERDRLLVPGMMSGSPGVRLGDVLDGTANTVMVGERPPPDTFQAGLWYPGYMASGLGNRGPNNHLWFGEILFWRGDDRPCQSARRGYFGVGRLDNPCDRFHFWSLHGGGGNWLLADGSVRFLAYSADPIMPALATRAGGEVVQVPE